MNRDADISAPTVQRRPIEMDRSDAAFHFLRVPAVRLAFHFAFGTTIALAAVQYSLRYGRLALPASFDDVVYLLDGGRRLRDFQNHGLGGLLSGFVARPLRSPYSSGEALLSFLLFGMRDWAPYVGNAVLLTGFLVLTDVITRGVRIWHKACFFVVIVSFPLLIGAATTCRPDFAAALLTTAAVFYVADQRRFAQRPRNAGLIFGLAILSKPSVFPSTMAVMIGCVLASATCQALVAQRSGTMLAAFKRGGTTFSIVLATCLLVVLPFALVQGRQTISYIYDNTAGENGEVWAYRGRLAEHLLYYLTGTGSWIFSGQRLTLAVAIVPILAVYGLRRRPSEIADAAPLAAAILVAYAICTANRMKNEFLGLTFQVCLLFALLAGLRRLARLQGPDARFPWAAAVLVPVTISAAFGFKWPHPIAFPNSAATRAQCDTVTQLFDAASRNAPAEVAGRPARVFVTFTGRISFTLLNYMAMRNGASLDFYDLGLTRDTGRYVKELERADLVVSCDPGMGLNLSAEEAGLVRNFPPSTEFRSALASIMAGRPDYTMVYRIEYPSNRCWFYVYRHNRRH